MDVGDVFLLLVRWVHLVAATAWIGGGLFYVLVLRPAAKRSPNGPRMVTAVTAAEFRALVDTSIFVLLATGIILTFNRLTPGIVGVPYAATLSAKIALSIWMFWLARGRRRRPASLAQIEDPQTARSTPVRRLIRAVSGYNGVVILGIVVFLLADLLGVLYEMALADR